MKPTFLLLFLLAFFGCDKDTVAINPSVSEILGSWKMVRQQYSIGGPPIWENVEHGETLTFMDNLTFTIERNGQTTNSGSFRIQSDSLIRTYANDAEKIPYISNIKLKENKITLNPLSPNRCIEGCAFEYSKTD